MKKINFLVLSVISIFYPSLVLGCIYMPPAYSTLTFPIYLVSMPLAGLLIFLSLILFIKNKIKYKKLICAFLSISLILTIIFGILYFFEPLVVHNRENKESEEKWNKCLKEKSFNECINEYPLSFPNCN